MKTKKIKGLVVGIFSAVLLLSGSIGGVWLAKEYKLNRLQQTAMQELIDNKGDYDESKIVLYDTSQSEAQFLAEKFNAKLRITNDGKFATLTLPDGMTVEDVYAARENRQYLSELSLDYKAKTSELEETLERLPSAPNYTVSDTYYAQQSYFNYLNVGDAWTKTRGNGVTVAVIDTGIDTDHSEFLGKISEYSYNATEDKIVKDYVLDGGEYDWSLIEDEQGHGTAVAGTVAAAMDGNGVIGVASQASLLVIKVECDANGNFYNTSDLVFGLYYAIERDVDVVNMSFGAQTPVNPFAAATKLAVDSDIVCVAAAGNDGNANITYPAADEHVLGVGALETNGWELANYSNYGENVNLVAPGTVLTTKIGGEYGVINGTSFSSPIVAGAVALYKTQDKYATFAKVQELLYASAYDLGALGCDWEYGYGALDINALICEEKGKVTFDMLTDELDDIEQIFVRNHTLQNLPEPERTYAVFDGWYYDIHCTEELNWYEDVFTTDLTLYANWVNEEDGVPYTYVTLDDGTVEIRSYTGKRRYITIPDEIEGKTVSSIGDFAFKGQTRLREVNLPRGLKNIGQEAFANCNNLIQMEILDGVTKIGDEAFKNNVRLSSVAFTGNSKLQTIGSMAFAGCSKLQRFEIPKTVASVDGSAFYGATKLQAITVKAGNTSFVGKNGVLYNYTSSTLVAYPAGLNADGFTVPATVREIGLYAFAVAPIASVELSNVQTIGEAAFAYSKLESVAIPDSVTAMGASAFAYSEYLKEATLGNGLNAISGSAFYLTGLRSIQIPANIQSIGGSAFANTASLTSVTFESGSKLTVIGDDAFFESSVESIKIPQSVVSIGGGAFAKSMNVYALKEVAFEENSRLQSIGGNAFANNLMLQEIVLPENLRMIGGYALMNTGLVTVEIPASVTMLGVGAFASCHSLTAIEVAEGNTVYQDVDGVVYDIPMSEIIAYPAGNAATSYTVLNGVEKIGDAAFYGAYNLTSVILPDGLTTVGEYGFYECISITGYTLPTTLTAIEQYAFAENESLTRIAIPDNVIQIGRYAFAYDWNCKQITFNSTSKLPRISFAAFAYTGITSFRVPANVSTIAQYAFTGCDSLTSVTFAANSKLTSISAYMFQGCDTIRMITFENGSALTSIQAHGLEGMRNLTTVNFGDAEVTNIDNYAFRYNEKLTNITIPETVTYIGRYAFYGDKALTSLTLSENIDYIGKYAFYHANNLNVYFKAEVLPENLQEYWDEGIKGYYVGVTNVVTSEDGNWDYATLASGGISIIKYKGTETAVDLTAVDLGGDIVSIGGYAFYNTAIESIVLPETLTTIGRYAFGRSKLTAIDIPASVEFIGNNAFFNVKTLQSVTFAQNGNLRQIEQYAFAYTESLLSAYLPASLEKLGSYSFFESGLQNLTFADGSVLTEIPEGAFQKTSITSVTLPDSVNYIDDSAFRDCLALQTVHFGTAENIQIHSNAFYNTGITTLYIPENVEYIGEYAFVGLEYLNAYEVAEGNPYYASVDGILYDKKVEKVIAVPAARTGKITLPQTVENLGFGAFENSDVTEVEFAEGSNILTFGYRAFYGADNLTTFTVPASVVSIDFYAFANCDRLETVLFEEGSRLTGIYEGAFYGCKSLKNITLPDSIVEISDFAFYGCTSLDRIPVSETNELKGIYDYAFAYTGITELTLPETIIDIGAYAFKGIKIKELTLPETNKWDLMIGIGAFEECNELTEITLPFIGASYEDDEITWFGYIFGAGGGAANATYVPTNLKQVTITEGITFIGRGAFYGLNDFDLSVPHSVSMLYNNCFYNSNVRYQLTNTIVVEYNAVAIGHFSTGIYGMVTLSNGVTSIGWIAFYGCSSLTEIVIPDGVTSIGESAFSDCSSLTEVVIPDGVTSIGDSAFEGCSSLTEVVIPDGVTSIGDSAFEGCSSLTEIEIPNSVTSIGWDAFSYCYSLTEIVIPDGVTSIGGRAFFYCRSLTEIVIPDNVTSIGQYAFSGCSSLTEIVIPDSVTVIGRDAFWGCSSLTGIVIPNSVTSIGQYAFSGCSSLTEIVIPDSVTVIGWDAFWGCSSLYRIVNYSAYLSLDDYSSVVGTEQYGRLFYYAKEVVDTVSGNTYTIIEGFSYIDTEDDFRFITELDGKGNTVYKLIAYLGDKETVTLPTDINGNEYAIYQMSGVRRVIIPDGVTSIGDSAFEGCSSLTEIVIPDGVTGIGRYSFYACANLTEIVIPNSVTSIGWGAFSDCSSLTEIIIPDGVTSIENWAFKNCPNLVLKILENSSAFAMQDGVLYNKAKTKIIYASNAAPEIVIPATVTDISSVFSSCAQLTKVTFEEGSQLTSIGEREFYNCYNLTEIVIPDNVTSIGYGAFYDCENLMSVTFGEESQLTSIGGRAFSNCYSLTEIIIPDRMTSIGQYAFYACENLTEIVIPDGVTSIGSAAFSSCPNLVLKVEEGNTAFAMQDGVLYNKAKTKIVFVPNTVTEIVIPATVTDISSGFSGCAQLTKVAFEEGSQLTSIGYSAFSNCSSLTEIVIPDSVTSIGDYAFDRCSNLTEIEIPNSVMSIAYGAFYCCANLTSVTFGEESQLTSIGSYAFRGCNSLTSVEIPDGVTSIGSYAFYGCSSLTEIVIPDNVTSIGNYAFDDCYSLTSVTFGEESQLTSIGNYAFYDSDSLTSVTFGEENQLTSIGNYAFYDCDSLTSVTFGEENRLTSIGSYAFYGCNNLMSVTFGEESQLTSIGESAFSNCYSLTEIVIPDGVTSIGNYAFAYCSSLTEIIIPDSMTSIGSYAFSSCRSLTEIVIPDGVTSIGDSTFGSCESLYRIVNNSEYVSLEDYSSVVGTTQYGCLFQNAKEVVDNVSGATYTFVEGFSYIDTVDGFRFMAELDADGNYVYKLIAYLGEEETVTLPTDINGNEYELYKMCGVEKVIIPESMTSIGDYAFSSLKEIVIPNTLTSIGENAFKECSNYLIVNNSEYLSLDDYPSVVGTTQYGYLFNHARGCVDNVSGITYTFTAAAVYIDTDDGFRFKISNSSGNTRYTLTSYLGDEETVTLPIDIYGNEYTIYEMKGVKKVIVPDGVTNIPSSAFWNCTSLIEISVSDSVEVIGSHAFAYCYNLATVTFGDNSQLTSIKGTAFTDCTSLSEIVLPDSLTSISAGILKNTAFYNDTNNWENGMLYCGKHLIDVDTETTHITLREDVGVIVSNVFSKCYSLRYLSGLGGNHQSLLSSLTNLETLIITEMPSDYIYQYFGSYSSNVPITLKNIVLKDSVKLTSTSYSYNPFYGITGVTVYVEANEQDVMWDDDYQNWHNGNTVYYGEDWITASFYGENGELLDESIYLNTQVVRIPYVSSYGDEQYTYVLDGWDLDGDGVTDSLPATSNVDIVGKVIMKQVVNTYTVTFLDKDGKTALYSYVLPYGTEITLPETPAKDGYTFLGWSGYTEGMTVTGDVAFVSQWQHTGDGHVYGEPVWVEPTCEEQGYYKHACTLCGEWYGTDYVDAVGHSYSFAETVAPTCLAEGYDVYACACGASYKDNFVAATGHYFGEWIVDEDATCLGSGKQHRDCYTCGHSESEDIMAHGHSYVGSVTKAATCTRYGEMDYVCEYCGDSIKEYTPMTAHDYRQKTVSKTWLQWLIDWLLNVFYGYEGNNAYYYECADCRHVQTLGESLYSVSSVQSTCAHELGDWTEVLAATCEEQGVLGRVCSKCNEVVEAQTFDALGHDYSDVVIVAPDCVHQGYTLHTCVTCGDYYANAFVEANGHTESDWLVDVEATCENAGSKHTECTVCGEILAIAEIPATGHTEVIDNAVEATCTTTGLTSGKHCSVCGKVLVAQEVVDKLDHEESNWLVDVEASCENAGSKHTECTVCGEILAIEEISATGHTEVVDNAVEATCTTTGLTAGKHCEVCGKTLVAQEVVDKLDHEESNWLVDVAATCENAGSKHTECTVCGEILAIAEIPAIGHTEVVDNAVSATCTTTGLTVGKHCSVCGKTLVAQELVEKLAHTESDWIVDVAATCENAGSKHTECTVCGEILAIAEIPATGHTEVVDNAVSATCTATGLTAGKHCEVCGKTLIAQEVVDKLDHEESDWLVDVEATCENVGSKHTECTVCGEILAIAEIPATGHTEVVDNAVSATCTATGLTAGKHCEVCGKTLIAQEVVDKLAHTESDWIVDVEETCENVGNKHTECTVCGEILTIAEIPATGHDYETSVTLPTCTEQGYTTYTCYCGDTYKDNYVTALGHTEVVDNAVTPTCTTTGLTVGKHCSVCGKVLVAQEVVEKLAHTESDWIVDVEAGCENAGSKHTECTVCGEILAIAEMPTTGHDVGDWIVDQEPTQGESGYRHKECSKCGRQTDGELIDALPVPSKGCGSSITGISFSSIACLSAAGFLFMRKRKKS